MLVLRQAKQAETGILHRAFKTSKIYSIVIVALIVVQCSIVIPWNIEATTIGRGFISAYIAPYGIMLGLVIPILVMLARRPSPPKRSYDLLTLCVAFLAFLSILMIVYTMRQMPPLVPK